MNSKKGGKPSKSLFKLAIIALRLDPKYKGKTDEQLIKIIKAANKKAPKKQTTMQRGILAYVAHPTDDTKVICRADGHSIQFANREIRDNWLKSNGRATIREVQV